VLCDSTLAIVSALKKDFCRLLLAFYVGVSCEFIHGVDYSSAPSDERRVQLEKAHQSHLMI